jgi:hypothetical protein
MSESIDDNSPSMWTENEIYHKSQVGHLIWPWTIMYVLHVQCGDNLFLV